jgi:hypothetical protein
LPGETTPTDDATQADADQSPQEGKAQGGQQSKDQASAGTQADAAAGSGDDSGEDTLSPEEARKLRQEHRSLRTRLRKYEEAEEKAKRDGMTPEDRVAAAEKDRDQTRDQLRRERVERQVLTVALAEKAVDPDAVVRLIDTEAIEYDADGKPTNVSTLVKDLLKSKPYLRTGGSSGRGSANGGEGGGGQRSTGDFNSMLRRAAGREG